MVPLADLWLPILLAAFLVFVASSVIHMALPIHKRDYTPLPGEASLLDAMRRHGLPPGQYMFPCPGSMKEMGSPEMLARFKQGPVGSLVVRPNGPPAIGTSLLQWFLYSVAIGVFVAYIAGHTLDAGAPFAAVFRVTGAVAVLAYATSNVTDSIWKGISWSVTAKFMLDGVVYGVATAVAFAWLWPTSAL